MKVFARNINIKLSRENGGSYFKLDNSALLKEKHNIEHLLCSFDNSENVVLGDDVTTYKIVHKNPDKDNYHFEQTNEITDIILISI